MLPEVSPIPRKMTIRSPFGPTGQIWDPHRGSGLFTKAHKGGPAVPMMAQRKALGSSRASTGMTGVLHKTPKFTCRCDATATSLTRIKHSKKMPQAMPHGRGAASARPPRHSGPESRGLDSHARQRTFPYHLFRKVIMTSRARLGVRSLQSHDSQARSVRDVCCRYAMVLRGPRRDKLLRYWQRSWGGSFGARGCKQEHDAHGREEGIDQQSAGVRERGHFSGNGKF